MTAVTAGRVGRAHGRDGSFYVEDPVHPLSTGGEVSVGGKTYAIVRRAGTDQRPLVRLAGIDDRESAAALRGEVLTVEADEAEFEDDEYLVADLIGCEVPGLGYVERVLDAPSCPLLEVGEDALLVPLVSDAVKRVDLERRIIEVDREFLGY